MRKRFIKRISPAWAGAAGFAGMLSVYFLVLTAFNGPSHALSQFRSDWWWVLAFAAGMGAQLWLHVKIREGLRAAGASAGASAAAMLACCAHHAIDFAPLASIAFLAGFLDSYQPLFISAGLLANVVGISHALARARSARVKVPFSDLLDWGAAWRIELAAGAGLLAGWAAFSLAR